MILTTLFSCEHEIFHQLQKMAAADGLNITRMTESSCRGPDVRSRFCALNCKNHRINGVKWKMHHGAVLVI